LIVAQLARGWEPFKRFVLDADAADGGAASARRHLQWELGALARVLLEKDCSSTWEPDSAQWESESTPEERIDDLLEDSPGPF